MADQPLNPATISNYAREWRRFEQWCTKRGRNPLPADERCVLDYFAGLNGQVAESSLRRIRAAIEYFHAQAGEASPLRALPPNLNPVSDLAAGKPVVKRQGVTVLDRVLPDRLKAMIRAQPSDTATGLRDRCLLVVGAGAALHATQIVALEVHHVYSVLDHDPPCVIVHVPSDMEQVAKLVCFEPDLDPVRALGRWLKAGEIKKGPLFRRIRRGDHVTGDSLTDSGVKLIVRRAARLAGLPGADSLPVSVLQERAA